MTLDINPILENLSIKHCEHFRSCAEDDNDEYWLVSYNGVHLCTIRTSYFAPVGERYCQTHYYAIVGELKHTGHYRQMDDAIVAGAKLGIEKALEKLNTAQQRVNKLAACDKHPFYKEVRV